jgi:hypothetical protein
MKLCGYHAPTPAVPSSLTPPFIHISFPQPTFHLEFVLQFYKMEFRCPEYNKRYSSKIPCGDTTEKNRPKMALSI